MASARLATSDDVVRMMVVAATVTRRRRMFSSVLSKPTDSPAVTRGPPKWDWQCCIARAGIVPKSKGPVTAPNLHAAMRQPFPAAAVMRRTRKSEGMPGDDTKAIRPFVSPAGKMGKDDAGDGAAAIEKPRRRSFIKSSDGDRRVRLQPRRLANVHLCAARPCSRLRAHGCPARMHAERGQL